MQAPAERLGSFYLGAEYDLATGQVGATTINYDARDLTTHAVCVGMTGSGKTGLCICLLEEAMIDKVPLIVIDPKGDMTNLLLHFPELAPAEFEPWINVDDARRKGQSVAEYAQATATMWQQGLADWGMGPDRIRLLQEAANLTIYTPGSDAGSPVSILGSLKAPSLDFAEHGEAIRERIGGTVAALLGLVGLAADPLRSREAILLSNIFEHFWSKNEDLDLAKLITSIQNPPVRQLGVFDVDTFYPENERFALAMAFNNLIASPGFQSWLQGQPLDVDSLLYTADGQPRHSIFYISHLSDNERMFFVTLLLENVITWMRGQPGTTSLRALLYFDEIFGFLPPTAEPPSKRPLMTLMKQARAFGLGAVLVTQNPVDIDYKGLTNAGTWFIGKLQAERDKERVLQGLKGAIAEAGGRGEQIDFDTILSQLGNRLFLMHNVHEEGPLVFHTRWAMNYLRGPLTRPQVRQLMQAQAGTAGPPEPLQTPAPTARVAAAPAAPAAAESSATLLGYAAQLPALPPDISPVFLPVSLSEQAAVRQLTTESSGPVEVEKVELIYEAALVGAAEVRFVDRGRQINEQTEKILVVPAPADIRTVDWAAAASPAVPLAELNPSPEGVGAEQGPYFAAIPEAANSADELKTLHKNLADWLYYHSRLTLTTHPSLGLFQAPAETERAFKIRLQQAARERRDDEVDQLEKKFESQISRLQEKLHRAERDLADSEEEFQARKQQEMVGLGETVLGFFLGRRSSRALSSAASKRRLTSKAKRDVAESQETIEDLREEIAELEEELKAASDEISQKWTDLLDDLRSEEIAPRHADVKVRLATLAWLPHWLVTYRDGPNSQTMTLEAYPTAASGDLS